MNSTSKKPNLQNGTNNKNELLKSRKFRKKSDNNKIPYKSLSPSHMRPTFSSMRKDNRIMSRDSENPNKSTSSKDRVTSIKRGVKPILNNVPSPTNSAVKKLKILGKGAIETKKEKGNSKPKVVSTKLRAKLKPLAPIIEEQSEKFKDGKLISKIDTLKGKEQPLIEESGQKPQEKKEDNFAAPLPLKRAISPNLKLKFAVRGIKLIGPLGKGATSSVWLAAQRRSGFKFAIKYVKKSAVTQKGIGEQIMREFTNQHPLEHPNIIQSYYYFIDNTGIFTAQEFGCYGQLIDLIGKSKRLSEFRAAKFTAQIADTLWYLRLKNIIHRDLKPENLLLDRHYDLKLTDFGSSICLGSISERRRTYCGTVDYISPELLEESHTHTIETDYWSLGCVIYEMLTGKPPFDGCDKETTTKRIKNLDFNLPSHITDLAQDLIKKLIVLNPSDRLTPKEVLEHPWIKMNNPNYICYTQNFINLKDDEELLQTCEESSIPTLFKLKVHDN